MNHKRHGLLKATLLAACLTLTLFAAPSARADSFNITNCLYPTNYVAGWPTNAVGTNGLPQGTGTPINVMNQEWAGFYFQGFVATNTGTAGNIIVTLIRSVTTGYPAVTYTTNALTGNTTTNLNSGDWETTTNGLAPITLTIPVIGTNFFMWFTNLDRYQIGGANFIGVYSITNSATNCFITNAVMGLNKKIIPIRYP